MGYRKDNKPIKPESMLQRFTVRNGATVKAAFGCFYFKPKPGHDPHYHDHIGWPAPNYPGNSCQMDPPRDVRPGFPPPILRTPDDLEPIHLADEGYTLAQVVFDDNTILQNEFVECGAWFDSETDNVVRIYINTYFPPFEDKPQEYPFTVFVRKEASSPEDHDVTDAVCHGILTVLPGMAWDERLGI